MAAETDVSTSRRYKAYWITQFARLWSSAFIRFGVIGGSATLLQLLLLTILIELFSIAATFASAGSYLLSAIYNYLANFYLTFAASEKKRHIETAPKFIMVCCIGVLVNTLTFAASHYYLNNYFVSQVVAVFVTFQVNYLLHKFWIYRS